MSTIDEIRARRAKLNPIDISGQAVADLWRDLHAVLAAYDAAREERSFLGRCAEADLKPICEALGVALDFSEPGALGKALVKKLTEERDEAAKCQKQMSSAFEEMERAVEYGSLATEAVERQRDKALGMVDCERCDGAGWLWRSELHDGSWDGAADDTRYTCDDCLGRGRYAPGEEVEPPP